MWGVDILSRLLVGMLRAGAALRQVWPTHHGKVDGLKNFLAVFKAKLWCLEMSILSRFWRILGFWFMGCPCVCHCQFGTDFELVE